MKVIVALGILCFGVITFPLFIFSNRYQSWFMPRFNKYWTTSKRTSTL